MINEAFENQSRLNTKAIVLSILSTFSLMILFMILAGGLNLWLFRFSELEYLENAFWIWSLLSWIASLGISTYLATLVSKSVDWQEGVLHGFFIWACTSVIGCLFIAALTGHMLGRSLTPVFMWAAFIGDLFALGVSIAGGYLGSQTEDRLEIKQEVQRRLRRRRKLKTEIII